MKISADEHIRKKGPGKGKKRKNPRKYVLVGTVPTFKEARDSVKLATKGTFTKIKQVPKGFEIYVELR